MLKNIKEDIVRFFRKPCGCKYNNERYVSKKGNKRWSKSLDRVKIGEEDIINNSYFDYEWEDYGAKERKVKIYKVEIECPKCGEKNVVVPTKYKKDEWRDST